MQCLRIVGIYYYYYLPSVYCYFRAAKNNTFHIDIVSANDPYLPRNMLSNFPGEVCVSITELAVHILAVAVLFLVLCGCLVTLWITWLYVSFKSFFIRCLPICSFVSMQNHANLSCNVSLPTVFNHALLRSCESFNLITIFNV